MAVGDHEPEEQIPDEPDEQPSDVTAAQDVARIQQFFEQKTLSALNLRSAPKTTRDDVLPDLPQFNMRGYRSTGRGPRDYTQFTFSAVRVAGFVLHHATGYDFALMRIAAARDGIALNIRQAYRSFEQQATQRRRRTVDGEVYSELDPAKVEALGAAALPGKSNHHSGKALDLVVARNKAQFNEGALDVRFKKGLMTLGDIAMERDPIFYWLRRNAPDFGFSWAEGESVKEPWHWTHPSDEIVYLNRLREPSINADGLLNEVLDEGIDALTRLGTRLLYGDVRGLEQADQMSNVTRDSILDQQATHDASISAWLAEKVSRHTITRDAIAFPPAMLVATLKPYIYDFDTGRWGNEEEEG